MTSEEKTIILQAIDEAATQRVTKLFEVLMADANPTDEAFNRFMVGMHKLITIWRKAAKLIHSGDAS